METRQRLLPPRADRRPTSSFSRQPEYQGHKSDHAYNYQDESDQQGWLVDRQFRLERQALEFVGVKIVDEPNVLPNRNQKTEHSRKNKSKPQIARQPGEEPFLRNRRCLGQNCAEDHAMLRKLTLVTASVAGVVSATATWAQNGCYSFPQPVHARVVYLDSAPRTGGFWRCRLTPRYRWFCENWAAPGYVFYENIVTCY